MFKRLPIANVGDNREMATSQRRLLAMTLSTVLIAYIIQPSGSVVSP